MKRITPLLIAAITVFTGCTAVGVRTTEKEKVEFIFSGQIVDGETLKPIEERTIEIFTWYQPVFAPMSYKKLGEVVTDQNGNWRYETKD